MVLHSLGVPIVSHPTWARLTPSTRSLGVSCGPVDTEGCTRSKSRTLPCGDRRCPLGDPPTPHLFYYGEGRGRETGREDVSSSPRPQRPVPVRLTRGGCGGRRRPPKEGNRAASGERTHCVVLSPTTRSSLPTSVLAGASSGARETMEVVGGTGSRTPDDPKEDGPPKATSSGDTGRQVFCPRWTGTLCHPEN